VSRVKIWLILGVFAFVLAGCAGEEPAQEGEEAGAEEAVEETVQVSATTPILADFAEQVGGDRVEVFSIVPAGGDPHTFQPSPQDARTISESEVVFKNGLGLDDWIDGLIESAGEGELRVVELTEGLEPLEGHSHDHGDEHSHDHGDEHGHDHGDEHSHDHGDEHSHDHGDEHSHDHGDEDHSHDHGGEEHSHDHGHDHSEGDPHFWLDVGYARHYVEVIRDTLSEVDPEGAETYERNAEEYLAELDELDAYIRERAETIPEDQRKLVTFHEAFAYWAEAYGFEEVGVVLPNPEAEPSARELAELSQEIEAQGVNAIFTEPQFSGSAADAVAEEAGVETYEVYTDTLIDDESANTYVNMMRTNIDRMVEGLT
jgi:ABC-type Zn uptake system ZnuABC Zn-binding protein ZnuA